MTHRKTWRGKMANGCKICSKTMLFRKKWAKILSIHNDRWSDQGTLHLCLFRAKQQIIQTDNGTEFTYFVKTDRVHPLDVLCKVPNIVHKLIRPRTPMHNGKVERSHRNDQERFYNYMKFYSYEDLQKQMATYLKRSNNIPMSVLNWRTPLQKRQEIQPASNARFLCSLRS